MTGKRGGWNTAVENVTKLDPAECRKTKLTVLGFVGFGILVTVALLVFWVIPYTASL